MNSRICWEMGLHWLPKNSVFLGVRGGGRSFSKTLEKGCYSFSLGVPVIKDGTKGKGVWTVFLENVHLSWVALITTPRDIPSLASISWLGDRFLKAKTSSCYWFSFDLTTPAWYPLRKAKTTIRKWLGVRGAEILIPTSPVKNGWIFPCVILTVKPFSNFLENPHRALGAFSPFLGLLSVIVPDQWRIRKMHKR